MELNAELLIGTKVVDADGEGVGRIQEFSVEREEKACLVNAYLIGVSGLVDRLSAWTLLRPINKFLHTHKLYSLYEVPWQDMDLTDPRHPKLRTVRRDLRPWSKASR